MPDFPIRIHTRAQLQEVARLLGVCPDLEGR